MSYRKLGYGVISPIIQPRVVEKLVRKVNAIYAGGDQFVNGVYPDEWHYRPSYSLPHTTREIVNGWKSCPLIASLVLSKELAEGIQEITGWNSVRVGQDDVIWKPSISVVKADSDYHAPPTDAPPLTALNTTVGFHQDSAYISTNFVPYKSSSVTLWMALDDSDSNNGGLSYAEGSHKWNVELDVDGARVKKGGLTFMGEDGESYASPLINAGRNNGVEDVERTVVTPEVKRGGGLLHDQDTWHGSGVNHSEERCRRAIAVHYVNGDCRFRRGEGGGPWGECDYIYGRYRIRGSDELEGSFFPVVAGEGREEWIDDWVEVGGVGEGFKEQVRENEGVWGGGRGRGK
ncbi:hypothetical protein TrCOL_g3311 [Triparma columacea]|uniref:Phytanoyl-CoA dioxygenase n=1 Tax=Triparma columacea TaxID=722753 RepID=A0A9W7GAJ2_9STRA|nr:hypothetical protein TrCOL_g3311 [Triparma columacea]